MAIVRMLDTKCDRRCFLRLGGLIAASAVLAACKFTGEAATVTQVPAALPTAIVAPTLSNAEVQSSTQALGVACRTGIVNDPYPGHCKHYVDRNGNGFCDLSELGSGSVSPRS
jgi:hypothetical protein